MPIALRRFVLLYAAMYAAYGVASPFLPAFVNERGLEAAQLGLALGAGTAIRLLSAPLAGRIADLLQALRAVLVVCTALAALVTLGYLPARSFWMLVALLLMQAAALAPMTILSDALALGAASPAPGRRGFEYGWVRGTGSAAFIIALLISGQFVEALGLHAIIGMQSALLALAALAATRVPEVVHTLPTETVRSPARGVLVLLKIARFRTLVLVAALILGSHAMHDAFAVIRWTAAGVSPGAASTLWSLAVAAEVVVFFFIGPPILARLTPAGALAVAALAGILRWTVEAQTAEIWALALVQPLHGITFALLHLACMRLLARLVPQGLEGTAQALYGTVGIGGASALLTVASGALYGKIGAHGFWVMAALCAIALPLTLRLRRISG